MRLIDADALKEQFDEIIGEYTVSEIRKLIDNAQPIEAYPFEQVQELVKLSQQFAQEIENLKRLKGVMKNEY